MNLESEQLTIGPPKKLFQNANEFSMFIEQRAIEEGIPCYTALLEYCEEQDIDPEELTKSVNRQLKEKLAVEFAEMGMLKLTPSLY